MITLQPHSAATSSFDNTQPHHSATPATMLTAERDEKDSLPTKEDHDLTPPVSSLEQHGEEDEYREYLTLHERFHGSKEWSNTLRKIDLRLLSPLAITYLLAFLDRGNVGNAKVAGMLKDVPMTDAIYNTGLAAFFMLYVLAEIPSQYILKRLGAKTWLSAMLFSCGVVMAAAAAIKTGAGFIIFRLFLGLCEAGLMPGINFVLGTWYTREELGRRTAIFFGSASVAGAFSGILAFGLTHLDGKHGIAGWRWIFLVEGIITAGVGLLGPLLYIGLPKDKHVWLTHGEKRYLMLRQVYADGSSVRKSQGNGIKLVEEVAKKWHIWPQAIIYFTHSMLGYSITFTLPVIVKALNFSTYESYFIPVPIYFGACAWTILNAHISDKRKRRGQHIILPFLLCILGLVFTFAGRARKTLVGLTMTGLVFIVFGAYSATPPSLAWVGSNFTEPHKHVALGFQIGFGSLGGLTGSFIYLVKESPYYNTGYGVSLSMAIVAILCCILLIVGYKRVNHKRDALTKEQIEQNWSETDSAHAGDGSPHFRYWQ